MIESFNLVIKKEETDVSEIYLYNICCNVEINLEEIVTLISNSKINHLE